MIKHFPTSGVITLAKTRKYEIDDKYTAMISEEAGSGWCILKKDHCDTISYFFSQIDVELKIEDLDDINKSVIEKLWRNNLVFVDCKNFNQEVMVASDQKLIFPNYLLIKVTGSCNFACSYCYDYNDSKQKKVVNFEQVCNTIKFLLSKNKRFLSIVFHGGEPLLQFLLIKKIVEFTSKQLQREENIGKLVEFSLQTNGSLLTDEIIEFLEINRIGVGISLDGCTQPANMHRKSKNGYSSALDSFLEIHKKYPDFIKNQCGVLAVLHRDNICEAQEFIEWLQNLGVKSMSFNALRKCDDKGRNLAGKSIDQNEMTVFYKDTVNAIKSNKIKTISVGNITYYISTLLLNSRHMCYNKGPCGAAGQFLGIDVNGRFTACDCIPDLVSVLRTSCLDDSIANDPQRNFIKTVWNKFKNENCKSCSLFGLCGGGCIGDSYIESKCKEVDTLRCASSKFIYKELFSELLLPEKDRLLFKYYSSCDSKR